MATNLSNVSFTSSNRYEYIALKGNTGFSIGGGGFANTTVTIPHNLTYEPYYRLWYVMGSGKIYEMYSGTGSYNIDGNGVQVSSITVTTSNLVIFFENFGVPAASGTIYYRIYAEPLT